MKQPLASLSAVLLIVGAPAAFVRGAADSAVPAPVAQASAEAKGKQFAFAPQSAHPGS